MANSFVRYTGNNSTTAYSIPFSYRTTSDLTVTLAGSATTAFTLNAAGTTLTFNTAPALNVAIEIRRTTSQTTRLTDYASGSVLTENDLDTDSEQAFFMSQEAIDDADDVIKISNTDFQYDAGNKQIRNVANPTSNQDVATKHYLENTFLTTANKTALTTINANISNIIAVNNNSTNINSAVSNATNINTVATNIGSVNTVATDIAKVITVANDLAEAVSEVETVADDLNETSSEIEVVGGAITNVNNVGNNIANVNTVAGISANVTTVAGNNSNVSTVAGISSDVTAVAGISSDVQAVENIKANVTTVAGISGNVTSVAGIASAVSAVNSNSSNINAVNSNASNINTVAGNNSNISTVAGVSGNVTTVAGVSSNVTTVAGISSAVSTVSGMSTAINTANSNATNINAVGGAIANVNNVGGSIANVNTVATNLASVNAFGETYRIASSAPSTSLNSGDLYFNTSTNVLNVYGASGWQNAGSSVNGTSERFRFVASGTPTTLTGNDANGNTLAYDAGFIDVYLNGIKMVNGTDVTVTSGSSIVFASALTNGDIVEAVTYGTFSVANMNASNLSSGTVPSARLSGAYTGITSLGTITSFRSTGIDDNADATAITIDSSEKIGILNTSPSFQLDINSGTNDDVLRLQSTDNTVNFDIKDSTSNTRIAHSQGSFSINVDRDNQVASSNLAFKIDNTEEMRLTSTGLGIGTSTPQTIFHILQTAETVDSGIKIVGSSSPVSGRIYMNSTDIHIDNATAGAGTGIALDTSGNVGIGTNNTAPLGKFHVKSADSGASVNGVADELVLEGSGRSGMTILSGTSSIGTIGFGDSGNNIIGSINYNHDGNLLTFFANDAERFRISSGGNISFGTTQDQAKVQITTASSGVSVNAIADELFVEGSGDSGITIGSGTSGTGTILFGDSGDNDIGKFQYNHSDNSMVFSAGAGERMRVTGGGHVLFNCTSIPSASVPGAGFEKNGTASVLFLSSNTTSTANVVELFNPNGNVGTIRTSGSSTIYNTSSDYRLKENVSYDFDATTRLKQLKPARFNFIADADTTVDGFIAHEVSSIVPEAISGEKDAVNEDGSINPQGIDQSKLVPLLVKTIQELEARITTLENN